MKVSANFNGAIFNAKTGLTMHQWHLEADGTIRAPKEIVVTEALLAECSPVVVVVPPVDEIKILNDQVAALTRKVASIEAKVKV
jgi:hypothetical protein